LLPTGNIVDRVEGVAATLIDNGMPVVVMNAAELGITGYESCRELEENASLRDRLEAIRLTAGPMMNLGDVAETTVPKLTMVAAPLKGGDLSTRTFIPHRCHQAIGVLGAVSVATAALLPGSPAATALDHERSGDVFVLEHPTGTFETVVAVDYEDGRPVVSRAGIIRTARMLMDGYVYPRAY
jgi:4-oxalomesaconate tautomerase